MIPLTASFGFLMPHFVATTSTGSTIYVQGIQNVAIPVGSGATSATVSINSVSSTAFMLFQGFVTPTANSGAQSWTYVTLADSSTVKAVRNTAGPNTCTGYGIVVNASSNLVKSVQFGTITFTAAQTIGTYTITGVTTSQTVIHLLGELSNQGSIAMQGVEPWGVLTDSVTATFRRQTSGPTETLSFLALEFQPGTVSSVQAIAASGSVAGTTRDTAINSISTSNAIVLHAGNSAQQTSPRNFYCIGQLTSGTNFRETYSSAPSVVCNYNAYVVEFVSGVLASAVQRTAFTLTGNSSGTNAVTSVNTSSAICNYNRSLNNVASQTAGMDRYQASIQLVSSNAVLAVRSSSTDNIRLGYEIAEFN